METLTTINTLSLFDTTKEQRRFFVNDIVSRLQDGQADALKVLVQIKDMEDIITQLTSTDEKKNKNITAAIAFKNMVLDAAEKQGKKFQLYNAEFSIKEVGTVYDWSKCEDAALVELLTQQDAIKEKIKAKQDFLKTVPAEGLIITDESSGDTYKVYPPAKSSTTSVAVSLK